MKARLTDIAIKRFSLPVRGQVTYWDALTPGFGVRCSSKSKSFVVMYGEKRRLKTLGRYPNMSLSLARSEAKRFFVSYHDGPAFIEEPSISFQAAKQKYLKDCETRNKSRTVADYTRLLNRHFKFNTPVKEITRQHVMKIVASLAATPSEQSHAFVAIRIMMNWCVRHGYLDQSPVPPMSQHSNARNHVLSDYDLKAVYHRALAYPYPYGPIKQLLILTGQRRGEIAALRRSWISGDHVTFPAGFAKNKREHRFPLGTLSQQLLDTIPETGDLYFPAHGMNDRPFNGWGKCKERFDAELDEVAPYTLHDLRRTFATNHARIGTPIHVTERLLNHVSGTISGVAAVYNRHSYLEEMKTAVASYDRFLTDTYDIT